MSETPPENAISSVELPHRRQALVVGVNASPYSGLGTLNCAERDAEEMCRVLGSAACGFSATSLLGDRATSAAVQSAIIRLIREHQHPDDFLLFYFSGHGRYVGEDVYLVTRNFDPVEVGFNREAHLSLRLLRQLLYEKTQAGRVLLILDCCYSGEIAGSGPDANLEDLFAQIRQYLGDNATAPSKTTLAPRDAQRWTLTAAISHEQAKETDSHSLLTGHILRALCGEMAIALHGDMVQLEHLVTYLREVLAGQQSPMLIGTDGSKDCILARHPDKSPPTHTPSFLPDTLIRIREREPRFSGRPESLVQNFVGRTAELQVMRDKIAAQAHTGGYLTIVGPPGQGKSSVIARLVADEGPAQAVYHFIPNEPGRDPQKPLLQELIARLIVQHNLLHDLRTYAFEGKDWEDLVRDFHGLLTILGQKNMQETIYIDGLDQLPRELTTDHRDLSFLPEQAPSGIVFVLGTRPDDTLEPFKSREPVVRHDLTAFSLYDFRLLLERRQVLAQVIDQLAAFHTALQGNPLYLDRLAQELQHNPQLLAEDVPAIIGRLTANPRNIFGLTVRRLQRSSLWPVLRPILGLLLVAQEPLHRDAIQSFVQCTDDLAFSQGLEQLGTFLTQDNQGRYALFHLKLGEYLGQRKGEVYDDQPFSYRAVLDLHRRVANWCICDTTDLDRIWQHDSDPQEQMRRAYARQYYITHLYHGEAWDTLWAELDAGTYGRNKVRAYDPSARAYALDLDLGRQAASRQEVPFDTGLQLLPRLWFYSLLRCSLTSRADAYPDTYYQPLVLLGRVQEALGLAELLSSAQRKAHVFRLIALSLCSLSYPSTATPQPNQLLLRAVELVRGFTDLQTAVRELSALSIAFDKLEDRNRSIGLLREAGRIAVGIESAASQAQALGDCPRLRTGAAIFRG